MKSNDAHMQLGFSLLELLVAMAIMAILASIAVYGLSDAGANSRDAKRQADVRLIQAAVELYKNKNGVYPQACNGPTTNTTPNWSGETPMGTAYDCPSGGNEYIVGLAPEFIPTLPRDPRAGPDRGYVYTTNGDRTVYKFMALNSVENNFVSISGLEETWKNPEFYRCDQNTRIFGANTLAAGGAASPESWLDPGICARSRDLFSGGNTGTGITTFSQCTDVSEFRNDYAVSAGLSSNDLGQSAGWRAERAREYDTEIVRCR